MLDLNNKSNLLVEQHLLDTLPILSRRLINDEWIIDVRSEFLTFISFYMKKNVNFQMKVLSTISGIDLLQKHIRFCIAYDFISLQYSQRIRIRTYANEVKAIPSLTSVFKNADWWEKEVWDMFGVFFSYHFDLRRLLTDYGFEGYPMRKDFPLVGYDEVYYNFDTKRVEVRTLVLGQEMRATAARESIVSA
jgi:NADH:ubiquinone oxidoreductase subunit C